LAVVIFVSFSVTPFLVPHIKANEDSWSTKEPMPTARSGLGVAVVDGKIYAIGGSNPSYLGTNEMYDPETDTWSNGTQMPTPRYNLGVAVVNDTLYAIGGYDGSSNPRTENEQYTPAGYIPEIPSWIIMPLFMTATLSAVIVYRRLTKKASKP